MMPEMLDVVDADDHIIGSATKEEVLEKGLRFRYISIIVVNDKGQVLIPWRRREKKRSPRTFGLVAGGVQKGESYEEAAYREMQEEIGVQAELTPIGKAEVLSETGMAFCQSYVACHNGPFSNWEEEAEQIVWMEKEELFHLMERFPFLFASGMQDAVGAFKHYLEHQKKDDDPAEEYVDVVDEEDNVLRAATKKEVHEKYLRHRFTRVLVMNDEGKFVLHKRAPWLSEGNVLDSAGGHVASGEGYKTAALRELKEEMGVAVTPEKCEVLGQITFENGKGAHFAENMVGQAYLVHHNGPYVAEEAEIENFVYMSPDEAWEEMQKTPQRFSSKVVDCVKLWRNKHA